MAPGSAIVLTQFWRSVAKYVTVSNIFKDIKMQNAYQVSMTNNSRVY